MNKLYKIALVFLLVLSSVTGMSTNAAAATEGHADVTLHKVIVDKDTPEVPNTGLEMPDFKGKPLEGAQFTVYDVTEAYHRLIVAESDKVNAQENVIKAIAENTEEYVTNELSKLTTDKDGIAKFENLPLKKGSVDAIYLFLETLSPVDVSIVGIATPIVLGMPIYNGDILNTDIHLYPKNEFVKDEKVLGSVNGEAVFSNGEKLLNVTTGDIIGYEVKLNVPADIKAHKAYSLTDTPSNGLELINENKIVVKTKEKTLAPGVDYTLATNAGGGFTVNFNIASEATVAAIAGKQVSVSYEMKLTAKVDPDKVASNSAQITVGTNPQEELVTVIKPDPEKPVDPETPEVPVELTTGGKKFLKQDSHTELGLVGAEFYVSQGSKFAEFDFDLVNGEYVFSAWVDAESTKTKIVSGENGVLTVKGLKDGSYKLTETKAPSDKYVQLKDPIDFEVKHGTFGTISVPVLNIPKGLLPSTGGSGIYGYLLVGGFLVISAFVWNKRSNKVA